MAVPGDPALRPGLPLGTCAVQAPDTCAWCLGAGKYLEALDCEVPHAYLPVVCQCCNGTGRRSGTA
jgi:hypothetical protein